MKTSVTSIFFMALILLSAPIMAQDHHYLPLEPGNELWYQNTGDASLTAHSVFEAGSEAGVSIFNSEFLADGSVFAAVRGHFTGTPEGDIIWIGPEIGGSLIPFTSQYLTIDAPLFTGKVWTFQTNHPMFGAIDFTAEVVAEEMLTVPGIGSLYCYQVHYDEFWENFGPRISDRWFADGFGEVKFFDPAMAPDPFLVTAGIIISVEDTTWDRLKALYR